MYLPPPWRKISLGFYGTKIEALCPQFSKATLAESNHFVKMLVVLYAGCMKIPFSRTFPYSGDELVRRAGYGRIFDKKTNQYSYVRRFGGAHYPRFHMYINTENPLVLNLHLDQKRASYEGVTAHSGDYDSETVRAEARRIWDVINAIDNTSEQSSVMRFDADAHDDQHEPHDESSEPDDEELSHLAGMRF